MKGTLAALLLAAAAALAAPADEARTKADAWLELGEFRRAITIYADLLRDAPEDAVLYNRVGYAYLRWDKPAEAVPFFKAALRLRSDVAAFWNNLGVAHLRLGRTAEAHRCFRKAIALAEDPKHLYNASVAAFRLRRYAEAADWLSRAWRRDRAYVRNRFDRRRTLEEVRRMRELHPEDKELEEMERRLVALGEERP